MDLGNIKKKDLAVVSLSLPNGVALTNDDGSPMTITVNGVYSDRYRQAVEEQQNDRIKRAQASGGKITLAASDIDANRKALVAQCVEEWDITLDGQRPPKLTKEAAIALFNRLPFVYYQVNASIEEEQSFLEIL